MDIYRQLTQIFQDVFDNDTVIATPELTAQDVEEWTSLNHIRAILTIEEIFSVKFTVSEISGLQNVGEMVTLIESHLQ